MQNLSHAKIEGISVYSELACVASVSVGLESKKVRETGFSVFYPHEKWCESQKEEREGGGEGRTDFIPLPHPPFSSFWLSPHFSCGENTENPNPLSCFAPKPHGNACYAG